MADGSVPRLVLASASPRRRDLLESIGLRFEIRPADIDETPHPAESASDLVERLAREKAAAATSGSGPTGDDELVLAADTTVSIDGRLLGKPTDLDGARTMLRTLSGATHVVATGIALRRVGPDGSTTVASTVVITRVTMATLTEPTIDWYVATREPFDKAGGYAIQGAGGLLVVGIDGSHSNVVGLPLAETALLAEGMGLDLLTL